jgi:hypothetical protein
VCDIFVTIAFVLENKNKQERGEGVLESCYLSIWNFKRAG